MSVRLTSEAPPDSRRRRLLSHAGTIAAANAAVAALGLAGNSLLSLQLDATAFTAISLFLVAFQFLQEVLGKSLNWAMLRLGPAVDQERPGGGASIILATRSLQRRFAVFGPPLVIAASLVIFPWTGNPWTDQGDGPSRVLLVALAAAGAALAVIFQFGLGVLQLRERFFVMSAWMVGQSALRVAVWGALWLSDLLTLPVAIGGHLATTAVVLLIQAAAGRREHGFDRRATLTASDRQRVLRFGGTMVLATVFAAIGSNVDLFILDARASDLSTGTLRVAGLFASAIEMATNAVMIALLPAAGRAHDAQAQRKSMKSALLLGGVVTAGAALSLPVVGFGLPILFGERYAEATAIYPILLAGVACTALTDPLALLFVSRDRPGRFVVLNATMLAIVVLGNLVVPGEDRLLVAAWVRFASRFVLGAGIVFFLIKDSRAGPRVEAGPVTGEPSTIESA